MKEFLKWLRAARKDAGLTQGKVVAQLQVYQSYVSKCESGERRVDVIELADFSRVYGKSFAYFLGEE